MTTIQPSHPLSVGHDDAAHGAAGGAHGEHEHGEFPFLKHHFDTPTQQFESGKLGMWLFLATEVLFFGGLFVWYAVLRSLYPEMFSFAAQFLNTLLGGINTCVLILSSLTMALAVRFAQTNRKGALVFCLMLTWCGAAGFLVIKYFEYTHKWHENLLWGERFYVPTPGEHLGGASGEPSGHADASSERPLVLFAVPIDDKATPPVVAPAAPEAAANAVSTAPGVPPVEGSSIAAPAAGPRGVVPDVDAVDMLELIHGPVKPDKHHLEDPKLPANTHLFFGVYFFMTGLHAVHVIVGMGIITWLIILSARGRFNSKYYTPVDLGGLYWHIVDLIWIFLFPLFYIIH